MCKNINRNTIWFANLISKVFYTLLATMFPKRSINQSDISFVCLAVFKNRFKGKFLQELKKHVHVEQKITIITPLGSNILKTFKWLLSLTSFTDSCIEMGSLSIFLKSEMIIIHNVLSEARNIGPMFSTQSHTYLVMKLSRVMVL